jgi:hypothetical protein
VLGEEIGSQERGRSPANVEGGEDRDGTRVAHWKEGDVYMPSEQRYVEVETFYGTGDLIIDKLDRETLSKCKGRTSRVDVVPLTGVQALLYARRLIELAEVYPKEHDLVVNFYLSDVEARAPHVWGTSALRARRLKASSSFRS